MTIRTGDINAWYADCSGVCPTCKRDMKQFHSEANLFPHFMAICKAPVVVNHDPLRGPRMLISAAICSALIIGLVILLWRVLG